MAQPIKKSLKPIPSSLRGKKRYILFSLTAPGKLQKEAVSKAVWDAMLTLHGTMGTAAFRFWFIDFKPSSGKGIVRCAHTSVNAVISALLFVEKVEGQEVQAETLKTSGSLARLKALM